MTITVHHLETSRSTRVLWMLEELGIPYEIVRYERNPKTKLAPPELLAVHPLGKSPVVTDGDQTIAESAAILEYLSERYGEGRLGLPSDPTARLRYRYWLHFAEGTLMPRLLMKLVFDKVKEAPVPFFVRPVVKTVANRALGLVVTPDLERQSAWIERTLGEQTYFAGEELTAADVQMSFPIEALLSRGGAKLPHTQAWLARIHARPAYQRALDEGGPVIMS